MDVVNHTRLWRRRAESRRRRGAGRRSPAGVGILVSSELGILAGAGAKSGSYGLA